LRRYAAAALSVPVLALVYLPLVFRRSAARASLAVVVGAALGLGVIGLFRPAATEATPQHELVPLTNASFGTALQTGLAPDAPISVSFSTPMDRRSVESSLRVEPSTAVRVTWDASATSLTVHPATSWTTGTYHTVTIDAGAMAANGRPLSGPIRSAFLTRDATAASIEATKLRGRQALLSTAFVLAFDQPVDSATLEANLLVEPAIAGTLEPAERSSAGRRFVFRPLAALAPNTVYRLRLGPGVRDASGAPLSAAPSLVVRTAVAPSVVRFRPHNQAKAIERSALLSVRFTQTMDRRSTKAALRVTIDGRLVKGTTRFAENGTVLVFNPSVDLPFGKVVTVGVGATAKSATGLSLAQARTIRFRTVPRPAAQPSGGRSGGSPPPSGGGGAGGGTWRAVETYYLRLMNCTRTGGWVTSSGRCSSPGGRSVAALWIDRGISSAVARPYARLLATRGACDHYIGGSPGDRLRRAGYTSYIWAENLGCRSGNPYTAVLGSHRFFQDERYDSDPTDHYTNLMNPDYDRVGLGVWVAHGNVRLVVDFYHPR
jgi:Big-like domain-containing protein